MFNVVFFGTSDFAVPILEKLICSPLLQAAGFKIRAVVSNPDKIEGRKNELTAPPVKISAVKRGLPVLQPDNLKDSIFASQLNGLQPDLAVLASYGKILPLEILQIPKKGFLNIHPSLLPKFRGATPIQSAVLEGSDETGVSLILLDEQVDHGPVLAQEKIHIKHDDTYLTLEPKLAELGANLMEKILTDFMAGKIEPKKQDDSQASFCRKITKQDGKIDWQKPAVEIERQIRAFIKWPGSFTFYRRNENQEILKITKSAVIEGDFGKNCGLVQKLSNGEIFVVCGSGALELKKVHPAGSNVMDIDAFVRGRPDFVGQVLV